MFKIKYLASTLALLFLLCGCNTDEYYRDEAVSSARVFLLNDLESISPQNRAYIQYTYPLILQSSIFLDSEYSQLCFAWNLPSPKITLLVYGSGRNSFRFWNPNRVIFKKYSNAENATMNNTILDKPTLKEVSEKIYFREN